MITISWKVAQQQATKCEIVLPSTQLWSTTAPVKITKVRKEKSEKMILKRALHQVKHKCTFPVCTNTNLSIGIKMYQIPPTVSDNPLNDF